MPTNYTPNYQLNQWEPGDAVLRTDFNADNAKLDAALKAEADARSAAVSTLTQTVAAVPIRRFASGTYSGDGQASRQVSLGFAPKMVFVWRSDGTLAEGGSSLAINGGMAAANAPNPAINVNASGFVVKYSGSARLMTNLSGFDYRYVALG